MSLLRGAVAVAAVVTAACGGGHRAPPRTQALRPHATSAADRILPLLPDGAQVVVELDLARLRGNSVVGAVAKRALTDGTLGPLPGAVSASPLATADTLVLAAYGVGTAQAATITVLATTAEVPNSVRVGDGLVALGPEEWTAQVEARAALAAGSPTPLLASPELLALRDHAMPAAAPGATLRITARLSFDARISLARQLGFEAAPAQLSVWADVVDDFVVIVDADAADPGDKKPAAAIRRLEGSMRHVLVGLANDSSIRALGLPASIGDAHLVARGTWLRTIIAIGPAHLHRVVERATALLGGTS